MESSTAGPSSSIESSDSGPSTSSSNGPAAVNSSGSEPEDSHAGAWSSSRHSSCFIIEQAKITFWLCAKCAIRVYNCEKGHFVEKKTGIMGTFFSIISWELLKSIIRGKKSIIDSSLPAIWTGLRRQSPVNMLSCKNTAANRQAFAMVFTQLMYTST